MTNLEQRIFTDALRGLAAACNIPQFRCELFDEYGAAGDVVAVGEHACKKTFMVSDGRCGPGGAAALLRHLAGLANGIPSDTLISAIRNAASLTFDTDEQFDKMFANKP